MDHQLNVCTVIAWKPSQNEGESNKLDIINNMHGCGRGWKKLTLCTVWSTDHCSHTTAVSCHINKLVDIVFIAAHVSVLNQPLDLLFNHLLRRQKHVLQNLDKLCLQRCITDSFAHLQDLHNCLLYRHVTDLPPHTNVNCTRNLAITNRLRISFSDWHQLYTQSSKSK